MSLLREYSRKLLTTIFLSLYLQLLLLFFYSWFSPYVTDILIVIVYLSSNFCLLYIYFLSIHLKWATHLAQEKSRRKRSCSFFKMQLFTDYSRSFLLWGAVQQCYVPLAWLFPSTAIFMLKTYESKKQKVDNSCIYSEVSLH